MKTKRCQAKRDRETRRECPLSPWILLSYTMWTAPPWVVHLSGTMALSSTSQLGGSTRFIFPGFFLKKFELWFNHLLPEVWIQQGFPSTLPCWSSKFGQVCYTFFGIEVMERGWFPVWVNPEQKEGSTCRAVRLCKQNYFLIQHGQSSLC